MKYTRKRDKELFRATLGDGLDGPAWDALVDAVVAAHSVDAGALRDAVTRLDDVKSEDPRFLIYLMPLLMFATEAAMSDRPDRADGEPTEAELRALAHEFWPAFRRVIKQDEDVLATVFLMAWNLEDKGPSFTGMSFVTLGTAALAVLLEQPREQMTALRPRVAEWYKELRPNLPLDLGSFDTGPTSRGEQSPGSR